LVCQIIKKKKEKRKMKNEKKKVMLMLSYFGASWGADFLCRINVSNQELKRDNALEGLAAVVNRVTCSAPVPGTILYVHACHPRGVLPAPGLAGCPVGHGE